MNKSSAESLLARIVPISLTLAILLAATPAIAQKDEEPEIGLRITLAVYSGRPNPTWLVKPGPDMDKLVYLITRLEPSEEPVFDYDEWNRLGYSSFWIEPKGVENLPYAIHVWRDDAFLIFDSRGDKKAYALGATDLYDILVAQAEARDQEVFFRVYHRTKGARGDRQPR